MTEAAFQDILCEHKPSPMKLEILGIFDWPLWRKEKSTFPWTYDNAETCYFLKGRVVVTPEGGEPREYGRGDLVSFPKGLKCTWDILEDVEKHYDFS